MVDACKEEIRHAHDIVTPTAHKMMMMIMIMRLSLVVVVTMEVQEVPMQVLVGSPMTMVKVQLVVKQKGIMTIRLSAW